MSRRRLAYDYLGDEDDRPVPWGGPGRVDDDGVPVDDGVTGVVTGDDEDLERWDDELDDPFDDDDDLGEDDERGHDPAWVDEVDEVDAEFWDTDPTDHQQPATGEADLPPDTGSALATYRPVALTSIVESPLTIGAWLAHEVTHAWRGAVFLFTYWHQWVKVTDDRRTLDARSRMASRQDMVIAESDRRSARDTEARRGQRSVVVAALALMLLLSLSASWTWTWLSWSLLAGGIVIAGARKWTKPWGPWVGLPMVAVAPALAITQVAWQPTAITVAVAVLVCDLVGRWVGNPDTGPMAPPVTLSPEVSARALTRTVVDALETAKPPIHGLQVYGSHRTEHALTLDTNTIGNLTDDHLRMLERAVGAGWGRITSIPDPENSARRQITFRWRDPLAHFPKLPAREPGEVDATQPVALGRDENGEVVAATFAGRHVLIDGISGAGKSGLVLGVLDALCSAANGRVSGIDLTGGPELEAVEVNLDGRYAIDPDHAERILDEHLAEIDRRIDILRDGVHQRSRGEHIDRAWTCTSTPGDEAWFLVIDEFPTLAEHPKLLAKVHRIMRVGRKARVTAIVVTQDPTKQAMGGTVVTKGAMLRIGLAMPGDHIRFVFGDGAAALGYRPDLLTPSDDVSGRVNDAGKFYLRAGGARVPMVARAFALDLDTAADRALDRADWAAEHRDRRPARADEDAVEVPPVLAALEVAIGDDEFLPTARAVDAAGLGPKALANAVAPFGLHPCKQPGAGSNAPRGYTRSALVTALRGLS